MDRFTHDHLSDEELQGYLDRDPAVDRAAIEKKLRASKAAQHQLAAYRRLYSGLTNDTGFMLSANFSQVVVERIENRSDKKFNILESLVLASAVVAGLGVILYFSSLREFFLDLFQRNADNLPVWVEHIPILSSGNSTVFLFAAIIMLAIGFLDKLVLHTRHR